MPTLISCGHCNNGVDATVRDDEPYQDRVCDQCNGFGRVVIRVTAVTGGERISINDVAIYRRRGYEILY